MTQDTPLILLEIFSRLVTVFLTLSRPPYSQSLSSCRIGEEKGETLLTSLVEHDDAPSLAWFVKSMVGMERTAAQSAFADFLDRSLSAQQMRFVEMVMNQLTARGVMKYSALYETPFSQLHAGGPDELFAGREAVVDSLFATLGAVHSGLSSVASR